MIHARPRATLRLQFHKDFTFTDAEKLIPYTVDLGISHVYASPILTAQPGSMHGYDVIDPTRVNAEIGGEDGLRRFVAALRQVNLGLIVDIVPNHMAVGGAENPWWADVLRHGRKSRYSGFFDIDWDALDPTLRGKVLAPFLGRPYGDALDAGEIKLGQGASGEPVIDYFGNVFPIDPSEFAHIEESGPESFDTATPSGRALLHELLERQHYRLAWWGVAGDEINWRRFFDINGLAGLRTEVPEVFEETHATLFRLYAEGLIDGFRIDHVDGLSDPGGYCRRLRQRLDELAPTRPASAAQGNAYIVVEKILGTGENLPEDWGVDGTSGYDFMNEVSALQHDASGQTMLQALWHEITGRSPTFEPEEIAARREILESGFHAQLQSVASALHGIARTDIHTRDTSLAAIRRGLTELLARFPVYRTYNAGQKRSASDEHAFRTALTEPRHSVSAPVRTVLNHLDRWLGGVAEPSYKTAQTRFQQLSAPVSAKAVEDTAFYRDGRLLSRNDVGFDAARLGGSVEDFHHACQHRLGTFPDAMLATATHDHKRGEDLRARLAVLSELPEEWSLLVSACRALEAERPDPADELMVYQMVVGGWPPGLSPSDKEGVGSFEERLAGWQQKALREAKLNTAWAAPNEDYESRARNFLQLVLSPDGPFLSLLHTCVERIAPAGAINGLVQAVLKTTVPGMPDFFQGSDFWDFSLVDPDNRRPVDYGRRIEALSSGADPHRLLSNWTDGRIKQAVIHQVLALRRSLPELFARGDYVPLTVTGPGANHVIAFLRRHRGAGVMVCLPRFISRHMADGAGLTLRRSLYQDTIIRLPETQRATQWRSILTGVSLETTDSLPISSLLNDFPLTILSRSESA